MEKNITRGIRNNNPGNIIHNDKNKWQGLADVQTDEEFVQFKSMAFGIRALANTLITYQDKYNLRTIRQVIEKYAPASDPRNNPVNYYMVVSQVSKINEDEIIDFHKYEYLRPIIEGIILMENGANYKNLLTDEEIDKGLSLAGVEPDKKPLITKKQVAIATPIVIASGSTLYQNIDMVNNAILAFSPSLNFFQKIYSFAPWIAGVLLLGAAGYIIYDRIIAKKRGL